jgi:hypothetical protein
MKHTILNYALTYIDRDGNEVLISSNGNEVSLDSKPFYVSRENAAKKQKSIPKFIERGMLSILKHWYDKGIAATPEELKEPHNGCLIASIKSYEDALLIIENGLKIIEVEISVELNSDD